MARYIAARTVGLAMIPLVVGACENPAGSEDSGWVRATIADVTEVQFEGTGWFFENPAIDEPIRLPLRFTISSEATGASINQTLLIFRPGAGIPAVGAYTLRPLEEKDGMLQGFTAYYGRHGDGQSENFTALSGQLEITKSSGDRIEGTFRYTGSLYCWLPNGPAVDYDADHWFCGDPNTVDPAARRVEVTGSFSVRPAPNEPSVPN